MAEINLTSSGKLNNELEKEHYRILRITIGRSKLPNTVAEGFRKFFATYDKDKDKIIKSMGAAGDQGKYLDFARELTSERALEIVEMAYQDDAVARAKAIEIPDEVMQHDKGSQDLL